MLKIAMCDDCLESIKGIAKMLEAEIMEQDLDAEITLITGNQKEIYDSVANNEIDVLFLDVDFKSSGKNGIDFAKDLREINRNFYLIFLSAHQRYLHLSFTVKVYDYLFKPINKEILQDLISRLKKDYMADKISFLNINKWKSIRADTILYIEKISNKSHIITTHSEEITTKPLDVLLDELPNNFRRCHRSCIVNEKQILSIDRKNGIALLTNNRQCPVTSHFYI